MKQEIIHAEVHNYCKINKFTYPDKSLIDFILGLNKKEFKEALEIIKSTWKGVVAEQQLEITNLKKGIYEEEADKLIKAIRQKAETPTKKQ